MFGGIYYGSTYMGGSSGGNYLTVGGLKFAADYGGFYYGGMYYAGTDDPTPIIFRTTGDFYVVAATVGPPAIPENPTMFLLVKLIQP